MQNSFVQLHGSGFIAGSQVLWNGTPITVISSTSASLTAQIPDSSMTTPNVGMLAVVNPSPGGGTSAGLPLSIVGLANNGVMTVGLIGKYIVWDPVNAQIYVNTLASDGNSGGKLQPLDPTTGAVGSPVSVGDNPWVFAVSVNSKYLYVGRFGTHDIQRFILPGINPDITISLGADPLFGPYYPGDIEPAPFADSTIAVAKIFPTLSPPAAGIAIYDDASQRPSYLCVPNANVPCMGMDMLNGSEDSIQWNEDGSQIYVGGTYIEPAGDFLKADVTQSGFGAYTNYPELFGKAIASITYDPTTGYVYADSGPVVDPASGTLIGNFNAYDFVIPDGAHGIIYFLWLPLGSPSESTWTLSSFDIRTFAPISSVQISNIVGFPEQFIRWGTDGLAILSWEQASEGTPAVGSIYLLHTSALSVQTRK